jgi:hypothetical protein
MTTLPELVDEVLIEALHHQAPELPPLIDKLLEAGQTKGQVKQFTRGVCNVKVTPAPEDLMKRREQIKDSIVLQAIEAYIDSK